jgi:hypothetical protein
VRPPIFYASALRKAADHMLHDVQPCLKCAMLDLATRWEELAFAGGPLMLDTWQLLGREIDEWPWVVPAHEALARLHENMLRNDVT